MNFKIDPKKPEPIFLQIANFIKDMIMEGTFKQGDLLPSVRNLAFDLKVNPNTVQKSYKELEREGWVEVLRGEGYLAKKPEENEIKNYLKERKKIIEKEILSLKKAGIKKEEILNFIEEIWREK
ncbi:MAG: GntR family transcriptional regulator [Thermoanaerobaculia bacterium]